jgi:hypothetical protein
LSAQANVRLDDGRQLKGYHREWFEPIWKRYLPHHTGVQSVPASQPAKTLGETQLSNRPSNVHGTDGKCEKPAPILPWDGGTDGKPERGTAEDHGFDLGAIVLAESRLRSGKTISPELASEYARFTTFLDGRKAN